MAALIITGIFIAGVFVAILTLRTIYDKKRKQSELQAQQFEREIALYKSLVSKYNKNNTRRRDLNWVASRYRA